VLQVFTTENKLPPAGPPYPTVTWTIKGRFGISSPPSTREAFFRIRFDNGGLFGVEKNIRVVRRSVPPVLSNPVVLGSPVPESGGPVDLRVDALDDWKIASVTATVTHPDGSSHTVTLLLAGGLSGYEYRYSVTRYYQVPPNPTSTDQQYFVTFDAVDNEGLSAVPKSTTFTVKAGHTDQPPTIDSSTVSGTLPVPASGGPVDLSVHASDDNGVASATADISKPDGSRQTVKLARKSGTATNGIWGAAFQVPANPLYVDQQYRVTFSALDSNSASAGPTGAISFTIQARPKVTGVGFVALHASLDGNPNRGGGLRIFPEPPDAPDAAVPEDALEYRIVAVKAQISPAQPNVLVYFRIFDPDDPSDVSNLGPATDVDENGPAGDDNRPDFISVAGGALSVPTALTDPNGVATVVLTVSRQPGNNFIVTASADDNASSGVRQAVRLPLASAVLEDAAGNILPTDEVKRTDMLTVWRKVHVEVDRMGPSVTGNALTGEVLFVRPNQPDRGLTTIVLRERWTDCAENRFEGGRFRIGGVAYLVVQTHAGRHPGSADRVPVGDEVVVSGVVAARDVVGATYVLEDDDYLDGFDEGAQIPLPDCSRLVEGFAPAYVLPVIDLDNPHPVAPFVLHSGFPGSWDFSAFDNAALENRTDYWTVYVLGGMEGPKGEDGDPDPLGRDGQLWPSFDSWLLGAASHSRGGVQIYLSTITDFHRTKYGAGIGIRLPSLPKGDGEQDTILHEVCHLFDTPWGAVEDVILDTHHHEGGQMSGETNYFSNKTLARIRRTLNP
jgi:hypothetical protein